MKDCIDLHTHTLASGHAYSTIESMIQAARQKEIKILGITEHAPKMPGSCTRMYFSNMRVIPRERGDILTLFGVELNILDSDGTVDMDADDLSKMDLGIASLHGPCYKPGNEKENTNAYLNAMKNPYVNIIGHPDDSYYPVDYRALVEGAKEHHVLLEVNNGSLTPGGFRKNTVENNYKMLELCKEYQVPVIMDSDAHVDVSVGDHRYAYQVLSDVDFPEELVVNADADKVKEYLNYFQRKN